MSEGASNPELLRSLGKLTRGLSALFWGLPAWLIVSAETARSDTLSPTAIVPTLVVNLLLLYGLSQLAKFQRNERPWRGALDRTRLFGLINLGLCPFLFWFSRLPQQPYYRDAMIVLVLSALLFLYNLNSVLRQLGSMLPDETLRQETRHFTVLNRWLLIVWVIFVVGTNFAADYLAAHFSPQFLVWLQHILTTILLCLGLSPIAITMALMWKIKEVIFDSVFGARR